MTLKTKILAGFAIMLLILTIFLVAKDLIRKDKSKNIPCCQVQSDKNRKLFVS